MTPEGRLAAAIEVLDDVAASRTPADDRIKAWGKSHRFAGAKDRRAIADRVFQVLRARARLGFAMGGEDGRTLVIAALSQLDGLGVEEVARLFTGEGHAPAPLTDAERRQLAAPAQPAPDWVEAGVSPVVAGLLRESLGAAWIEEAQGLIGHRAPLDLRVNAVRGGVDGAVRLLATDGVEPQRTPWSALGLRLPPELAPDVQRLRAYATGWVEVQDEASQIAAALAGARPGMTVVDYCAGGGGKTLALGAAMANRGRLVALDVSARRLDAARPRLERADVSAELRRIGPDGQGSEDLVRQADLVFVDAPCSGSGTWRRHPEGAWRVTAEAVARLSGLQSAILARAADLVRPGGRLAYATCSVLAQENEAVAAGFDRPDFRPSSVQAAAGTPALTDPARARLAALAGDGHTLQMTPRRTGTDGFFIALFERLP